VNGVILKRLFTEGDRVTEGQQLYQIDPAPYQAALASAQASLARARAAVGASKLTVERYESLVAARAVSRQDYDNAVAKLQQDEADVAASDAAVRTAAINLAYTKVYSPISGRTGRSSVTEGALVTADQASSLLTVTQLDPVYVDLTRRGRHPQRRRQQSAREASPGGRQPLRLSGSAAVLRGHGRSGYRLCDSTSDLSQHQ
jgi:membrane fusion protein (multidrug efflux system)